MLLPYIKTTLYLPKSLKRLLELKARREGRSQAEPVREALERYLASPPPKSLGLGEDSWGVDCAHGGLP
ncbi:ribbon-helix-helix domain-containing protein [Thermus antranikianii]